MGRAHDGLTRRVIVFDCLGPAFTTRQVWNGRVAMMGFVFVTLQVRVRGRLFLLLVRRARKSTQAPQHPR